MMVQDQSEASSSSTITDCTDDVGAQEGIDDGDAGGAARPRPVASITPSGAAMIWVCTGWVGAAEGGAWAKAGATSRNKARRRKHSAAKLDKLSRDIMRGTFARKGAACAARSRKIRPKLDNKGQGLVS